jgi:hypothetical protein
MEQQQSGTHIGRRAHFVIAPRIAQGFHARIQEESS